MRLTYYKVYDFGAIIDLLIQLLYLGKQLKGNGSTFYRAGSLLIESNESCKGLASGFVV